MMRTIIVLCLFLAAFSHAQTYLSNYQTYSTYISKYNPASFYIYGQGLSQIQLNTTTSTYGYGYQVFVTVSDYYGGGNNDTFVLYPSGGFSSFNLVDNLGNSYQYKYITITTESYYSIEISIQPNIGASMIQMEPGVSYLGLTSSTKSTNFGYYSTQGFTVQYSGDYVQFYLSNSNYATPYNYIAALNSYYNTPTNYSVNPCELASTGSISGSWYINVPTHTYKKQYTLAILPASDVEVETIYTNQPYYPSISSSSSTFKVYLTSGYLTTLNISDYSSVPSGSMSYSVSMYYGDCASSSSNTISTIYGSGALAFFSTITGYYTINIKTPYESQVFSLQVNQIAPNTLESVLDLVSSISNTQFQFDTYTPIYFKYTGPSISIYLSTSVNAYIKKGSLPSSSDYDYSYYSSVITIGDCDDESSTYYIGITTSYSSNSYITIMSSLPTECGTSGTGYGSSGYVPISYHSYHSSSINLVVIIVPAVFCVVCIIILAIVIAVRNKRRLNRAKKHGEVTYTTNNKGEHKYTQLETMPSYVPTAQYVQPQVYAYPANYYHPNYPTVAPGYIVPSQLPPQLNQQLPSYITPIGPTPPFYTIPNPVQIDNINNTIVPEEKK